MTTDENVLMNVQIKLLAPGDEALFQRVVPEVFDHDIVAENAAEFLRDARHHMAAAIVDDHIVGIASAVNYLHPDRPPELWVNEVGVAPAYRRQGVATRLLDALFELGRTLGCGEAWVLTEPTNEPALALYRSAGGQSAKQMLFAFQLPPR